jgi:hypothetical protein
MSCRSVINSLSAHLDGVLSAEERRAVLIHLSQCRDCETRLEQLARVRGDLRALPPKTAPVKLVTMLRVAASRERERVLARQRAFERLMAGLRLRMDNLMRPMALPVAGGLISAVLLFSILIPSFAFQPISAANDVPVALITEPTIKASMPFGFDSDAEVEAIIDDQGRMVDYTITRGPATPELRRAIENNLLFTEFTPATMFGTPTFGKINILFQRRTIDIRS